MDMRRRLRSKTTNSGSKGWLVPISAKMTGSSKLLAGCRSKVVRQSRHDWGGPFRAVAVVLALAAGQLGLGSSPVAAHTLPTNTVMNAFVKIEPRQADLVIRIPAVLLPRLPFPRQGLEDDLAAGGPVLELAVHVLSDGFVFLHVGVS